jgi:hypothetical protein
MRRHARSRPPTTARRAVVVTLIIAAAACSSEATLDGPAGAALLTAGSTDHRAVRDEDATVHDLDLRWAVRIARGTDDDDLRVLVDSPAGPHLVEVGADELVEGRPQAVIYPLFLDRTSAAIAPTGEAVVAYREIDGTTSIRVDRHSPTDVARHTVPFHVGALHLADDMSVLAAGLDDTRLVHIAVDGTTVLLLGPPGSGARVTTDDLGTVVDVLRRDDGRIAFVADERDGPGGERLYLLDDTTVTAIDTTLDGEPVDTVRGTGETPAPGRRADRSAVTALAPSPDGRILTTGLSPGGHPRIALVDADTGAVEVLARLDGVAPTVDDPLSAAIVGPDLIFLARHRLWRIPGVVAADPFPAEPQRRRPQARSSMSDHRAST